jgi:MFS family permease
VIVAAQFAGVPLLSPVAAMLINRYNRHNVLTASQVASAVVAVLMAACYAAHLLSVLPLAIGAALLGAGYSLGLPAQVTLVPGLVRPDQAEAALKMNSASYNSGRALAPALSVLIIASVGPGWVFVINAVSFAVFAAVIPGLEPATKLSAKAWLPAKERRPRLTDGAAIALRERRILLLLFFVAAITLADDPIQVLSPSLTSALNLSHDWTGLFIAALGWGAASGSMLPKSIIRPDRTRTSRETAQRASRRAAWWLLALAILVVVYALGLSPWFSLAAAVGTGVAALMAGTAAQTPIVVRDRRDAASIAALWAIAWAGTKPVASLLDGWLAGNFGLRPAVIVLVLPAIVLAGCELLFPAEWRTALKQFGRSGSAELMAHKA